MFITNQTYLSPGLLYKRAVLYMCWWPYSMFIVHVVFVWVWYQLAIHLHIDWWDQCKYQITHYLSLCSDASFTSMHTLQYCIEHSLHEQAVQGKLSDCSVIFKREEVVHFLTCVYLDIRKTSVNLNDC